MGAGNNLKLSTLAQGTDAQEPRGERVKMPLSAYVSMHVLYFWTFFDVGSLLVQ